MTVNVALSYLIDVGGVALWARQCGNNSTKHHKRDSCGSSLIYFEVHRPVILLLLLLDFYTCVQIIARRLVKVNDSTATTCLTRFGRGVFCRAETIDNT